MRKKIREHTIKIPNSVKYLKYGHLFNQNVDDLPNIQKFAQEHGIEHSWAYLKLPKELSVENSHGIFHSVKTRFPNSFCFFGF